MIMGGMCLFCGKKLMPRKTLCEKCRDLKMIKQTYTYRFFKLIGRYWPAFDREYEKIISEKMKDVLDGD